MADDHHLLMLPDGRHLAYIERGDPDGVPVFSFHGLPGSRLQVYPDEALIRELGARIISPDRPGMGFSTFQPGRRFTFWPRDVEALADHLKLERFRIIATSGGCPYALATARALDQRVEAVALASGIAPLTRRGALTGMLWAERLMFRLARYASPILLPPFSFIAWQLRRKSDWGARKMVVTLPESDLRVSKTPAVSRMFHDDFMESTRQGARAVHQEATLLATAWDFDPAELPPELPVLLWHGDRDNIVPESHGRWLAQTLPNCHPNWVPGQGHYLVLDHFREILSSLLSATR